MLVRFLASIFVASCVCLPAMACSCMIPETAAEQAEGYELVFFGTVIDTGEARDPRNVWQRNWDWLRGRSAPDFRDTITTFQVDETFKGQPGRNIAIRHLGGAYSAACGVSFLRGRQQVILAYPRADGGYATSSCAMPQFSEDAYREALLD